MSYLAALDPTVVSAWSAVAIVLLTAVLAYATIRYANEARRTNDLTEANLRRILLRDAPVIQLEERPILRPDGSLVVSLRNVGSGVATEIWAHGDWGPPIKLPDATLGADEEPIRFFSDPNPDVRTGEGGRVPKIREWRFTDTVGATYRQPLSGRPEVIDE